MKMVYYIDSNSPLPLERCVLAFKLIVIPAICEKGSCLQRTENFSERKRNYFGICISVQLVLTMKHHTLAFVSEIAGGIFTFETSFPKMFL